MMYTTETFKVEGEMYICLLDSFLDILLHLNYPHGVHSWSTSDVFWALNLCPVFSSWVVLPCCIQLLHECRDIGSYLLQLCGSWNVLLVVLQLVAVLVLLVMERRLVVLEWFEGLQIVFMSLILIFIGLYFSLLFYMVFGYMFIKIDQNLIIKNF